MLVFSSLLRWRKTCPKNMLVLSAGDGEVSQQPLLYPATPPPGGDTVSAGAEGCVSWPVRVC